MLKAQTDKVHLLAHNLRISEITARVLVNRGITGLEQARGFLNPELSSLEDPFRYTQMDKAIKRIEAALRDQEPIAIFADYDVDGIAGAALLVHLFRALGQEVITYIPHRVEEGYGLNLKGLKALASEGVKLVLTIDCGVADVEQIAWAKQAGIDVIVLDHHTPIHTLPEAYAILNPRCQSECFDGICACGIALKLAWAMSQRVSPGLRLSQRFQDFFIDAMALVAMGTLADVVPLVQENRVFVVYGLEALRRSRLPGIKALLRRLGLEGQRLDPYNVWFQCAPRLNAAGRIQTPKTSLELLITDSSQEAERLVEVLEVANRQRQLIQDKILREIRGMLQDQHPKGERAPIVCAGEGWHPGVLGVVAARLVEEFCRPCVLIGLSDRIGRGSIRSIPGLDLASVLEECSELLLTYGGHSQAAGLTLDRGNLEAFKARFVQATEKHINPEGCASLVIDAEVSLNSLTPELVVELQRLGPFGPANPVPLFMSKDVSIAGQPRPVGQNGEHLQMYVTQHGTTLRAIAFGKGQNLDELVHSSKKVGAIVFEPGLNLWQGYKRVELKVKDLMF